MTTRRATPSRRRTRPRRQADQEVGGRGRDLDARLAEYKRTRDRRLRDELIADHRWLAEHCARRYARRGEPLADLVQVAQVGLLKAIERFDPARGVVFSTFAVPTIIGELRRHFRDATWTIHVPRRMKELYLAAARVTNELEQAFGRSPTAHEVAEAMDASVDDVLEALDAGYGYRAASLTSQADEEGGEERAILGRWDAGFDAADARLAVTSLLDTLPTRERRIVELRFFGECSQSEIARELGISQVHVSRLLRVTLEHLGAQFSREGRSEGRHAVGSAGRAR